MAKLILALIVALSPAAAVAQSTTGTAGPAAAGAPAAPSTGTYGPPAPTIEAHSRMPAAIPAPTAPDGTQTPQKHRGHRRGSYAGTDAGING